MKNSRSLLRNTFSSQGILLFFFLIVQLTLSSPDIHVYIKDAFCTIAIIALFAKYAKVKGVVSLLLFCVINFILMFINHCVNSNFELFSLLMGPLAYFLFGYSVVDKSRSDDEVAVFLLLTIISSSLILWKNNIDDAYTNGLINTTRAILNENDIQEQSATLQGLIASLGIAGIAYPISHGFHKKGISFLYFISALLSLFCVIHLVNRSGLFVLLATVFVVMLYTARKHKGVIILVAIIALSVYYIISKSGMFVTEAMDAYQLRNENSSIVSGGMRVDLWEQGLHDMIEHPFGWSHLSHYYCHNLWLDVARCVGIIPFAILVVISIKNYRTTFKLYRIKGCPMNGLLVGLNVCMFLSAFVEPVLEGKSTYFYLMCMVWGMQRAYYERIE